MSNPQEVLRNMSDEQLRGMLSAINAAASGQSVAASQRRAGTTTPVTINGQPLSWQAAYRTDAAKQRKTIKPTPKPAAPQTQTQAQAAPNPAPSPYFSSFSKGTIAASKQASATSYAARLKTGTTVLMQPILQAQLSVNPRGVSRRAGMINYAEPGSGDELDGVLDSDDSDFASQSNPKAGAGRSGSFRVNVSGVATPASAGSPGPNAGGPLQSNAQASSSQESEINPLSAQLSRTIPAKLAAPLRLEYTPPEIMERHAQKAANMIPIRVEIETDTHRIRDSFLWNCNEELITADYFAQMLCADLNLPYLPYAEQVSAAIRSQVEEHEGIASLDLTEGLDEGRASEPDDNDCRVLLALDVQIANYHLVDTIEWDLMSNLSPEEFAEGLCADIGLPGESIPIIAHAVYEELLRHKRDAVEWGAIGGDREETVVLDVRSSTPADSAEKRERSGMSLNKDKAGLGLGAAGFSGRRDSVGRGSKRLRGIWRDWNESEEWSTRLEELTPEEVERREIERERASRRTTQKRNVEVPDVDSEPPKTMTRAGFNDVYA